MQSQSIAQAVRCPECGSGPIQFVTTVQNYEIASGYRDSEDFYLCLACKQTSSATDILEQIRASGTIEDTDTDDTSSKFDN